MTNFLRFYDNFFVAFVVILNFCQDSTSGPSHTAFLLSFLEDYDSRIPPSFDNEPTLVSVAVKFDDIDSISEANMDFSTHILLTQEWYDNRLKFFGLIRAEYLELDTRMMTRVWVPDLYFANERQASLHMVTVPNKLMHIYSDGRVRYTARLSITASCPMNLHKYPLDTQSCPLILRSFAYSTNNIILRWAAENAISQGYHELPQFTLHDITHRNCCNTTGECSNLIEKDTYSCIRVDIVFKRELGYYMIQIFVPSLLVVALSWVSFWLSVEAVPARISLGILTVLTMTTQRSVANSSLPRVSYIKAIDVWMAICLIFVISALLEYAFANVLMRTKKCKLTTKELSNEKNDNTDFLFKDKPAVISDSGESIDRIARLAFPLTFVAFCALYWTIYSHVIKD